MWNCLKCFNENSDNANFCAYCGSTRTASLENAKEIATAYAASPTHQNRTLALTLSSEFPTRIPIVLRLSEAATRAIAAILGVAAGLATSLTVYFLADPSGMTGRLFNLAHPSGLVPVFTLILFYWGFAMCVFRYFRTGAAKRLSSDKLLVHSMELSKAGDLNVLVKELETPVVQYSPLLRRIRAIARQWSTAPSLQDADVLLQQQLYTDEENVKAGYSLVRTFIWALPVMGLLGTVAGVAVAVGGFAEFLGGNIEDVAVIKQSLVNVTAGLSYAFLTTLYGLAGALILMLIATVLQNREEKLYTTIQEKIANIFLPFLQSISPETKGTEISSMPGLQEQLMSISASVLDYVRQQGTLTLQSFKEERNALREDVVQWSKLLREEAATGTQNIGQALDRVGIKMSNAQFEFLQKFESIKVGMDQQAASVLQSITAAAESAAIRQQQTLNAISEQHGVVQDNVQLLTELSKVSEESLHLISDIKETLRSLKDLELDQRASQLVRVMDSQSKQIEASMSALNQTSALTTTMLAAQGSLQDSVNRLHDTGFEQTLAEFRDSLTNLKPVLENLREPFILQAVPIRPNGTSS